MELFLPEGGGEEQEDGEELETPGEHDEREHPFCSRGNIIIVAVYAGDIGAQTGVGYRRQAAEETIFKRQTD